jgi:hypothetical protein
LASGAGIAATHRPSGFHRPASTISTPQTRNAPTAALNPPATAPEVASSAPPGVDHATVIGSRVFRLSQTAHSPMEIDSAIRPDVACPRSAPTAISPCTTTANELANPTNAASNPAASAWNEKPCRMPWISDCPVPAAQNDRADLA